MKSPILFIFSGLPGSGKSTLAGMLSSKLNATYLRIDTVEQGLRDVCGITELEGMGYRLSHRIAQDNLSRGNKVIADSVNPWKLTRDEWNQVATDVGADFINIEIICSDPQEHQARVESRGPSVPGLKSPTWKDVLNRDYHAWDCERLQIDTRGKSVQESFDELVGALEKSGKLV